MISMLYLSALAIYLLFSGEAHADGLYTKSSPVLQLNGKSYEKLVAKSTYATVRV